MSVQAQIDRINQNVANTYSVLESLGANIPATRNSDNLSAAASTVKAVLYSAQTLTDVQEAQARANIKAASAEDVFASTEIPLFTNIFDTIEIQYGKTLDSSGNVEDTGADMAITDFIPVTIGQTVRVKDFALYTRGSTPCVNLYNASKAIITYANLNKLATMTYYFSNVITDENGDIVQFTVAKPSSLAYIRICNHTSVIGKNPVLTVNEPIEYEIGYGTKLNPDVTVDYSQIVNSPQKNAWNILPHERLNIAYSSIGRKPINTVEHFTDAAENYGYNALKCDVRPTSDGELVCCHDAGFTFDSNGYITTYDSSNQTKIHDVTAATCLGYSFRTGEHPCLVGDYLEVCRKYGKVAFITIRNEYMDVVIPKLLEELRIHNMTYSSIINCMTYNSLVQWRQQDQAVMINYTLNAGVAIDQTQIDRAIDLGYCSLCGFGLNSSVLEPTNTCDFEYARANGIRLLQAIAYQEGSPEACYALGYDGCQIARPWGSSAAGGVSSWNDMTDKPFGDEEKEDFIIPETAAEFVDGNPYYPTNPPAAPWVLGRSYTVVWNGTSYTCTANEFPGADVPMYVLGNTSMLGGEDTGEPFLIAASNERIDGVYGIVIDLTGGTSAIFSVYGLGLFTKKIPEKYIPEIKTENVFYAELSIYNSDYSGTGLVGMLTNSNSSVRVAVNDGKLVYIRDVDSGRILGTYCGQTYHNDDDQRPWFIGCRNNHVYLYEVYGDDSVTCHVISNGVSEGDVQSMIDSAIGAAIGGAY